VTRYVILGLLRNGSPSHGYALMKGYRERSGVPLATGGLYRELARLVEEGLVANAERGLEGDPRRTPYVITAEGEAAFDAWLAASPAKVDSCCDDELTTRAIFLADAPPEVARDIVSEWKDELWAVSKTFERTRQLALRSAEDRGAWSVLPILLGRRLKHIASDLAFLDDLLAAIRAKAPTPDAQRDPTPLSEIDPRAKPLRLSHDGRAPSHGPAPSHRPNRSRV
jgi:DNA-binding PadR family transcriptional regulator